MSAGRVYLIRKVFLFMDVIDFAAMSDTDDLAVASPGACQTKYGRASFKSELTKRYGSKYRDPDNSEKGEGGGGGLEGGEWGGGGRTDARATRKGLWHPRNLHVWAQPAD